MCFSKLEVEICNLKVNLFKSQGSIVIKPLNILAYNELIKDSVLNMGWYFSSSDCLRHIATCSLRPNELKRWNSDTCPRSILPN